jgi:hypothetical protein
MDPGSWILDSGNQSIRIEYQVSSIQDQGPRTPQRESLLYKLKPIILDTFKIGLYVPDT